MWTVLGTIAATAALAQHSQSVDDLLKQGFALHQQARFSEAIPLLERAHQIAPGDYFANLLLGIDLLRTGKPVDAIPHLALAARTRPAEAIPQGYLGEAEAAQGHYASAARSYRRAMELDKNSPESVEAWAGFALERFRQIGERLRATDAGVATVRRLARASAQMSELRCREPIPELESRLTSTRDKETATLQAAYDLSICYALEAGHAASSLESSGGDAPALARLKGDVLLRLNGDVAGAEKAYQTGLAARPRDPALLARLAEAQLAAGESEAAVASARAALQVDPHRVQALRTLASQAMAERNYPQALPWLQQLSAETPADMGTQIELARALAETGDASASLAHLQPALKSGYPDEKGALHALLARQLRVLGRDAEAAQASAEARRLSDAFQARTKVGGHEVGDAHP